MEQKNQKIQNKMTDIHLQKLDMQNQRSVLKPTISPIERTLNFLTKEGKKGRASSLFRKTMLLVSKKMRELDLSKYGFHSNKSGTVLESLEVKHDLFKTASSLKKRGDISGVSSIELEGTIDVYSVFSQSLENVKPVFEVKKVRIAGSTHQVPALVSFKRQEGLAIRWIIQAAKDRKKKNGKMSFEECLAFEIVEAFKKQGGARHKRDDLHKLAEANRAYSHYKWW